MNALLLSATKGTRLLPLTLKTPKCLLPLVNDKPMLQYWIDTLLELDINKIFINIFPLKEKIISYIESLPEKIKNKIYIHNEEFLEPTGMVLSKLSLLLDNPILIIYPDTYIEKSEVKKFIENINLCIDYPVVLGIDYIENTRSKGKVTLDEKGIIIKFQEKPGIDKPGYFNAGIMMINNSVINFFKTEELSNMELTLDILPAFENKIIGIRLFNTLDIGDSLETYYQAYERFNKK